MKYMGSKRAMLKNGLGLLLQQEIPPARRFVDLFTGSGAVAAFVATRFSIPVIAVDLQEYGSILAHAVVGRCKPIDAISIWTNWLGRAKRFRAHYRVPNPKKITQESVAKVRQWCGDQKELPIAQAYGGHYFSANQALWFDALRATLPKPEPSRTVALAALIQAASQCAAAPGHTAQPFQPTRTAKQFLKEGWDRSVLDQTKHALEALAPLHAKRKGHGRTANANAFADKLTAHDVVFLDPPYSGVHYSRFYHVLETIARGEAEEATGVGRYPAPERRPRSSYSIKTQSSAALNGLLRTIAARGATAILTFPDHECSNGLSGNAVFDIAQRYFQVAEYSVESTFSTLGGTNGNAKRPHRAARQQKDELILLLRPYRPRPLPT